jgi:hypothetical protein
MDPPGGTRRDSVIPISACVSGGQAAPRRSGLPRVRHAPNGLPSTVSPTPPNADGLGCIKAAKSPGSA